MTQMTPLTVTQFDLDVELLAAYTSTMDDLNWFEIYVG